MSYKANTKQLIHNNIYRKSTHKNTNKTVEYTRSAKPKTVNNVKQLKESFSKTRNI